MGGPKKVDVLNRMSAVFRQASAAETLLKLREAYVELDVRDRKRVRWIEREREGGQVPRQTKVQAGATVHTDCWGDQPMNP